MTAKKKKAPNFHQTFEAVLQINILNDATKFASNKN